MGNLSNGRVNNEVVFEEYTTNKSSIIGLP
jgi:hypothetical protein